MTLTARKFLVACALLIGSLGFWAVLRGGGYFSRAARPSSSPPSADSLRLWVAHSLAECSDPSEAETIVVVKADPTLAVVANEPHCQFYEHGAMLSTSSTLSMAGWPRYHVSTSTHAAFSILEARCPGGRSTLHIYRAGVEEGSQSGKPCGIAEWRAIDEPHQKARVAYRQAEFQKAAEGWAESARRAEEMAWRGIDARRWASAALAATRAHDFEVARSYLDRARAKIPSHFWLVRGYIERFEALRSGALEDSTGALEHHRRAIDFASEVGTGSELAFEYLALAGELARQGRDREALLEFARLESYFPMGATSSQSWLNNRAEALARAYLRQSAEVSIQSVREAFEQAYGPLEGAARKQARLDWLSLRAAEFELAVGNEAEARLWLERTSGRGFDSLAAKDALSSLRDLVRSDRPPGLDPEDLEPLRVSGRWAAPAGTGLVFEGRRALRFGRLGEAISVLNTGLEVLARRSDAFEAPSAFLAAWRERAPAAASLARAYVRAGQPELGFRTLEAFFRTAEVRMRALAPRSVDSPLWRSFLTARRQLQEAEEAYCSAYDESGRRACERERVRARAALESARYHLYQSGDQDPDDPPLELDDLKLELHPQEAVVYALRIQPGAAVDRWTLAAVAEGPVEVFTGPLGDVLHAMEERHAGLRRIYVVGEDDVLGQKGRPRRAQVSFVSSASAVLRRSSFAPGPVGAVLDPDGTLPSAAEYAGHYSEAHRLLGPAEADQASVLSLLSQVTGLHYVGHGVLLESNPLATHLRLADGLLAWETLTWAPHRLRVVLLEGCKTASGGGWAGLPQAFLARGSWAVLATRRDLEAGEATAFVRRFIEAGGFERPGAAFLEAERWSRAAGDPVHGAFTLYGPLEPLK